MVYTLATHTHTQGRLLGIGEEDNMISFTPSVPGTIWGGVILEDTTQANYVWNGLSGDAAVLELTNSNTATVLTYCSFENGGDPTRGFKASAHAPPRAPVFAESACWDRRPHARRART